MAEELPEGWIKHDDGRPEPMSDAARHNWEHYPETMARIEALMKRLTGVDEAPDHG